MKPIYAIWAFIALLFSSPFLHAQFEQGSVCSFPIELSAPPANQAEIITGTFEDNWYTLTVEEDAQIILYMCGINTCDTRIWIYSACPTNLESNQNIVAQNDDACGMQSQLITNLIAGNTYLIRIGDFATSCPGSVVFSWSLSPVNGGCTNPASINYDPSATFDDGSCIIQGCTDNTAMNYDPYANQDNGSCEYCNGEGSSLATLYLCTFSNAANVSLTITNESGDVVAVANGANAPPIQYLQICLQEGVCYTATMTNLAGPFGWYGGYFWVNGNGQQFINAQPASNAQSQTVQFSIDGTCGPVVGCMDPQADNYNPLATQSQYGSCIYSGCMDPYALNYDPTANASDDSCEYCSDSNGISAQLYVCTFSNGNQVELQILDDSGNEVIYIENLPTGAIEYYNLCLQPGVCYTVNMINNTGPFGWYNGYYWVNINGYEFSTGALSAGQQQASTIFSLDGTCGAVLIPGCTDPAAINFNPQANVYDGSCVYPYTGCMDPIAINYDPYATIEGECFYPEECLLNWIQFDLYGSVFPYEMYYEIVAENGEYVGSGFAGNQGFCLPDGCYTLILGDNFGDGWDNGVLDVIVNGAFFNQFTLENSSWGTAILSINSEGCSLEIEGCMDGNAMNYNPYATTDDGSCVYYEDCVDNLVSVSITTQIWGSEVSWSVVNSAGATVMTGNGYDSWEDQTVYGCLPTDCYELQMMDSWGDGWNGAYVVISGYNTYADATLQFGAYGTVMFGSGMSCFDVTGCTDSQAINFNPEANVEDGSCVYNQNGQFNGFTTTVSTFDALLFPNPTNGIVQLQLSDVMVNEKVEWKVFSSDGRLIETKELMADDTFKRIELNYDWLESGIYFLHVTNNGNNKTISFIKE